MSCSKKSDGCIPSCHGTFSNLQARCSNGTTKQTGRASCLPLDDNYGGCQGIASGHCRNDETLKHASEHTLKFRSSPDSYEWRIGFLRNSMPRLMTVPGFAASASSAYIKAQIEQQLLHRGPSAAHVHVCRSAKVCWEPHCQRHRGDLRCNGVWRGPSSEDNIMVWHKC